VKIRIRPAVLLGEIVLTIVACVAMLLGIEQVALVAATGIVATMHKLVESEEKTNG